MRNIKSVYGNWCLVAGGAEGLGEAYSLALARKGLNIIMVDNQAARMSILADRLEAEYGIKVRQVDLDLSDEDAVSIMMAAVEETGCRLIIYNAAYSKVKKFGDNDSRDIDMYVNVNVRGPIQLALAFLKLHKGKSEDRKGMILMSSLAGLWGTKFLAPYGATKAFNRILAEALHTELKPLKFDVMTCIAGATATPAYLGNQPQYGLIRPSVMKPIKVAEGALNALGKGALYVPGLSNLMTYVLLSRLLPRKTTVKIFNRTVEKMFRVE